MLTEHCAGDRMLPSWLTCLVERHNAEVAGQRPYDAVYTARLVTLVDARD